MSRMLNFTNEYKRRFKCPYCSKTFIGLVPRGGDGSVRQFPYHTIVADHNKEFQCAGAFKVCK